MDITIASLVWKPPPGERIVSLCGLRDEVLIATDRAIYVVRYDFMVGDYPVEKIRSTDE